MERRAMRWGMPSNSSIGRRFCIAMETMGSRNMTFLGLEKIPQKYQEKLELCEVILRAADDLYFAI